MKTFLFSYGTLQKESVQKNLFGRRLQGQSDTLTGYQIVTVEVTDEAFLSKGENKFQRTLIKTNNINDTVHGTVLELSEEELLRADSYEPVNYDRIEVKLLSGRAAWLYVADETGK